MSPLRKRDRKGRRHARETTQPRPLSELERAIVERMLTAVDFPEADRFRAQIPALTVYEGCSCGCATVTFEVDRERAARAPSPAWDAIGVVLADASGPAWFMLFQQDGVLLTLEQVPYDDDEPPLDMTLDDVAQLDVTLQLAPETLAALR